MTSLAIIGAGYWGRNLVRTFKNLGVLAAVCDTDSKCLSALDVPAEVRRCTDPAQVLGDAAIEAIAIATPAARHFEQVRAALDAGKDVYVEKPLALSVDQGEALVGLAQDKQRILFVGHILRYHPAVRKLHELINAGELGKVQYAYSNRLNIGKLRTEENILWSFAPHDVSVLLGLLGEMPSAVSCQGGDYLSRGVSDVTVSQFVFPSGVRAHIFVSWLHPFKEQRLVVVGSDKMAVFDDTAIDKLVLYPHRVEWKNRIPTAVKAEGAPVPLEPAEPLKLECAHFLDCVRTRAIPLTDGHEGLRVLTVLDACQRSLTGDGRTIELEAGKGRGKGKEDDRRPETGDRRTTDNSISNFQFPISNFQSSSRSPSTLTSAFFVHPSAFVDSGADIGRGTKIWHFAHVMKGAKIGERCILGQNVNVDGGTVIGNNVKVQNNVSIYTGAVIEDDVFLGPSCVLTNVSNPRSQIVRHSLYEPTVLKRGCSIGANATIVCGTTIGRYAFVAAGSVVTRDVPDYALVMGNPARPNGWISRHGHRLQSPDAQGVMTCPESGLRYQEVSPGVLKCLDLDEESPLPPELAKGARPYREFKPPMNTDEHRRTADKR